MLSRKKFLYLVGATAAGATLAINPWFAYDPINLPKMLVVSVGAAAMCSILLFHGKRILKINSMALVAFGLLFSLLTMSLVLNDAPFAQQFYGAWGRSTGYLTYTSFIIISLFVATFATNEDMTSLRKLFEKLSYFISFYTLMQWADLDPIDWSQKLMVATLGNINFMSSFLGLATCSFLIRVFIEKIPLSSKFFFTAILSLNLLLILVSGSIQGIGIILTGCWIALTVAIRKRFGNNASLIVFVLTPFLGVLTFLGTAGIGPLSFLRQETVLYRIDYWKAGWRMTVSNPLFGVGIDSYGDFYRQYRDSIAVERTGPQRVTNTAHNVFLDVSSGSGVFAGLSFLFILTILLVYFVKTLSGKIENLDGDFLAWSSVTLGFAVFCVISINQIGVGVWGFVAIGILLSHERLKKSNSPSGSRIKSGNAKGGNDFYKQKAVGAPQAPLKSALYSASSLRLRNGLTALFSATVLAISAAPNFTDAKFLAAIKSRDLEQAVEISRRITAMDFHREVTIKNLSESGRSQEALRIAQDGVIENPRSWAFWVSIVFNEYSTNAEKKSAVEKLFALDPKNVDVKSELGDFINRLKQE